MSYLFDNTVPNITIYENIERKCYPVYNGRNETDNIVVTSKLKQKISYLRRFSKMYIQRYILFCKNICRKYEHIVFVRVEIPIIGRQNSVTHSTRLGDEKKKTTTCFILLSSSRRILRVPEFCELFQRLSVFLAIALGPYTSITVYSLYVTLSFILI